MIFSAGAGADRCRRFNDIEPANPRKTVRSRMVRHLLAGPSALLLMLPVACQSPADQAQALAQRSSQLADAGDGVGAIQAIRDAIKLRDDNAGYFMQLAALQFRSGKPADAYLAAQRALELDTVNVDALSLVANVGMQIGQVDDASDAANRLLTLDPNSMIGLQVKGLVQLSKSKNDEADATGKLLLAQNPNDIAGMIIHARVLAKAGMFEEALAVIDQGMGQAQSNAPLLITKINLYRSLKRPDDMLKSFDQLAEAVPDRSVGLRLDEINLLYRLGQTDRARTEIAALLANRAAGVPELAVVLRLWSEYDRVPYDRQTITAAKDWTDPVKLLGVGRYLLWQGQPQLADDLYFAFPAALRGIGFAMHLRAAYALGRVDEARVGVDQVLSRDPDNVDALLLRAELELKAGNQQFALDAVQRALNSDQTDPEVYVALAVVHARSGSKARAAQAFEDGLQQLPQNYLLIERYTQFLHDSGNKSRAVSVSRAFARAQPSFVRPWTIMAQQCAWAADTACAAEAAAGRTAAATRYVVDDPPGTPPDRGLLGKF